MKFGKLLRFGIIAGAGALVYRVYKQYKADQAFELAPVSNLASNTNAVSAGNTKRSISPELLEILACPVDKKPVELYSDANGKEWLLNPRNGYRYPIEDGIPIMLIDEGEKHKDTSLIRA
ncbi:Trm112 family protein [Herpetosiphon llansteffanensis]|uniref:Trm112 family protein n=1 Tax=Herpetosiphon llansteffanensis TaxID=2094568 RepID=UPI0013E00597|nr:Trm112 family protein [Herpetosiphon llansteffanensis]